MAPLSDPEVIAALGGPSALSRHLGYTPNRVKQWKRLGIPWEHRGAVAKIAAEQGVELPPDFRDERRRGAA